MSRLVRIDMGRDFGAGSFVNDWADVRGNIPRLSNVKCVHRSD